MTDSTSRLVGVFCVLVAVWVVVYWWWDPARDPVRVSFAAEPTDLRPVHIDAAPETAPPPIVHPAPRTEPRATPEPQTRLPARPMPNPEPRPVDPLVGVVPPAFEDYTIRPGDTYAAIAQARYGDERYWESIARANPLKDPRRIRPGEVIRLPVDPSNVQGRRVGDTPDPAPPRQQLDYVVKPGDTLGQISESFYGSARYAELIFEANRESLRDADDIRVGQTLRIPPPPASGGG